MNDYSDIIKMQWPKPGDVGKMVLGQRAKIFLPFAALTGYDTSLAKEGEKVIYSQKPHLDSDQIHEINQAIVELENHLECAETEVFVEVRYFVAAEKSLDSNLGFIEEIKGKICKFNLGSCFPESFIQIIPEKMDKNKNNMIQIKTVYFQQILKIKICL